MDDPQADLAQRLGLELHDFSDGEGEPPPLEDADQANRILRTIAYFERERQQIVDLGSAELRRLKAWTEERVATVDARIAWHARSLEGWMAGQDRVTVKLPNGEVRTRPQQPKVVALLPENGDPDAQLDTLESLSIPGLLRTTREIAASAVAKMAEPGPIVADLVSPDPDREIHCAVIPGVPAVAADDDPLGIAADEVPARTIPGVYFLVAKARKFGYTTATDRGDEPG